MKNLFLTIIVFFLYSFHSTAQDYSVKEVENKCCNQLLKGGKFNLKSGELNYTYRFKVADLFAGDAFIPCELLSDKYIDRDYIGKKDIRGTFQFFMEFNFFSQIDSAQIAFSAMAAAPHRYCNLFIAKDGQWHKIYDGKKEGGKKGRMENVLIVNKTLRSILKGRKKILLRFDIVKNGKYFCGIARHAKLDFLKVKLSTDNIPAFIKSISFEGLMYSPGDEAEFSIVLAPIHKSFKGKLELTSHLTDSKGKKLNSISSFITSFKTTKKEKLKVAIPSNVSEGNYFIETTLKNPAGNIIQQIRSQATQIIK